jgi:hypothetical protein
VCATARLRLAILIAIRFTPAILPPDMRRYSQDAAGLAFAADYHAGHEDRLRHSGALEITHGKVLMTHQADGLVARGAGVRRSRYMAIAAAQRVLYTTHDAMRFNALDFLNTVCESAK